MLRIGVTGGIGSGKSTICDIFEWFDVPVYRADEAARFLYNTNSELQNQVIQAFGPDVYANGILQRPILANLVFTNNSRLTELNRIVHPFVFADYEDWCTANQNHPYTLKEAAIMFESGSYLRLHYVLGVLAPMALRINRVMQREQCDEESVQLRIDKQLDSELLRSLCDFIVENDGQQSIVKQVVKWHAHFIHLAQKETAPKFRQPVQF